MHGEILDKKDLFLRQDVGSATANDGKTYDMSLLNMHVPCVQSKQTGKRWRLTWDKIVALAVAEGIDTPDAVEPDAPKTDCPAPLTFGKLFADPDDVGQSEYRAIYETVVDGVFDGTAPDADFVMTRDELESIAGIVDEFRLVATEHLSQLTKAIAHELERTAGTQK